MFKIIFNNKRNKRYSKNIRENGKGREQVTPSSLVASGFNEHNPSPSIRWPHRSPSPETTTSTSTTSPIWRSTPPPTSWLSSGTRTSSFSTTKSTSSVIGPVFWEKSEEILDSFPVLANQVRVVLSYFWQKNQAILRLKQKRNKILP